MSVNQTLYILYGAMLPYPDDAQDEDEYYEKIEDYEDSYHDKGIGNKNGVTIILDGMNGDFCAIGHVIDKVGRHGYATHVAIPNGPPDQDISLIRDAIEMMGYDRSVELGWHFIPNYS